jgi:hypothetical protein
LLLVLFSVLVEVCDMAGINVDVCDAHYINVDAINVEVCDARYQNVDAINVEACDMPGISTWLFLLYQCDEWFLLNGSLLLM